MATHSSIPGESYGHRTLAGYSPLGGRVGQGLAIKQLDRGFYMWIILKTSHETRSSRVEEVRAKLAFKSKEVLHPVNREIIGLKMKKGGGWGGCKRKY